MPSTTRDVIERAREIIRNTLPVNPDDADETVIGWERITTSDEERREEPKLPREYHVPVLGSVVGPADRVVFALQAAGLLGSPTPPKGDHHA